MTMRLRRTSYSFQHRNGYYAIVSARYPVTLSSYHRPAAGGLLALRGAARADGGARRARFRNYHTD